MKRKLLSLAVITVLSVANVSANEFSGAYDAGAFNKRNQSLERDLNIEKTLIEGTTKPKKEDTKIEADVQQDVIYNEGTFNPQFTLNGINFEGNSVIRTKELEKRFATKLIGQDVTFDDILQLTVDISRYYQELGYLACYAAVPPQEVIDGVVTIRIEESKIEKIEVNGEKWARPWYLKNVILGSEGLREGTVFNSKKLQGALKELNNQSYVQGGVTVSKNAETGGTELTLDVQDRFPVSLDIGWDDFGRDNTGRQRATIGVGMDNLTGFGDRIYGGTILSSDSTGFMAGYQVPVNSYGTKLGFNFNHSDVRISGALAGADIKGKSTQFNFNLMHPFIRNARTDLYGTVDFDMIDTYSKTDLFGKFSDYKLNVLRLGLAGMRDDKYGRWIGNGRVNLGLGGSTGQQGSGYDKTFFSMNAGATRVHKLFKKSLGIVRVNGQYSPNDLYATEQLQIGGPYSLRGYQPGAVLGDYGVNGTVEVRVPVPGLNWVASKLPERFQSIDDKFRLAAFYDFGYVKDNHPMYHMPKNFLQSVGAGAYIYLTDYLSAQLGIGIPIGDRCYDEDSMRFYFSVNSEVDRLLPTRPRERL